MYFLVSDFFFNIGNMTFEQGVSIPIGIDPGPFWANLFIYFLNLSV